MFHGVHKRFKDTEEVPSLGERQPMQPTDEQPLEPSIKQQPAHEPQPVRQAQGQKITRNLQEAQPERVQPVSAQPPAWGQSESYRGTSEQVLFPSAPYQPTQAAGEQSRATPMQPGNVPYQPGSTVPGQAGSPYQPGQTAPAQPGSAPWGYPPRPEHYQNGPFGQPGNIPGGSASEPFPAVAAGQFGQPFHSAATTPIMQAGNPAPPPRRSGMRTGTLIALAALLALVFGTGLFAGWQFGHYGSVTSPASNSAFQQGNNSTVTVPQPANGNADAVREAVISKVQPGIVQINVITGSQQALGSGVIIDGRGYIVTNNHVVSGANSIQVTLANNQALAAHVIGTDPIDDLAVIKITPPAGGLTTVTMGDSSRLRPGQEVLAIGSPLGNAETVTSGIISALSRNVSEGQNGPTLPDAIQTDAPINPGNSGGALVDLQGNLIGMPTLNAVDTEFNTPANGLGFAIPVNRIRYIAQQIITDNHVSHTGRAILGVTVTTVTANVAAQNHLSVSAGVLVVSVVSGGPSDSAGLKTGDVIVQIGNRTINSTSDVSATLLQAKPGDSVPIKISRGNQQLTVNVTLGELPAS